MLDQYGRYFTVSTGSDGQTVFSPTMGTNDDRGEGLNARLFLSNFPAREYVIVVSGSPNPTPIGTFTLSLTDVTSDDHPADSSTVRTLELGEPASGDIEAPGDVDWFAVDLTAGTPYNVSVRGIATEDGTVNQARLAGVYDSEDRPFVHSKNNMERVEYGFSDTEWEFLVAASGTYYVAASAPSPYAPNRSDSPVGSYTVTVSPIG